MRSNCRRGLLVAIVLAVVLVPASAARPRVGSAFPTQGLIAFACVDCGVTYLAAVRPNGTGLRRMGGEFAPARWSPDGRTLAFSWNGSILLHRLGGSADTFLTNPHGKVYGGDYDPAWFPDGKHVVFVRGDQPAAALWTVDVSGRGARLLDKPGTGALLPDVSPDGRRIVYADPAGQLWLIRADGTGRNQLGVDGFAAR